MCYATWQRRTTVADGIKAAHQLTSRDQPRWAPCHHKSPYMQKREAEVNITVT